MFTERTSVGLDVHARSVVAHAMDVQTGEIFKARLCPDPAEVTGWIKTLPGPAAAIYEAGPTGYDLARTLLASDIRTVVAAPSKLQRPSGSRVKTDAIDAEHLSTLLRLDAFTAVTVPDELTEAARDLVRARADCRSDLMRTRHRLSKLLLRHGIVYSGGQAWVDPATGELAPVVTIVTDNGGPFRSFRFESFITSQPELAHVRTRVKTPGQNGSRERGFGTLKYERFYLDEIDDALVLAERAEDYRIEYNELRPHEAISWNRPKKVHLGLADPTIPTFKTKEILPTT